MLYAAATLGNVFGDMSASSGQQPLTNSEKYANPNEHQETDDNRIGHGYPAGNMSRHGKSQLDGDGMLWRKGRKIINLEKLFERLQKPLTFSSCMQPT